MAFGIYFQGALRHSGRRAGIQRKRQWPVDKQPAVYILAGKRNSILYTALTSDLVKRVWEHKNHMVAGFTKRYSVHRLVWCELHGSMGSAILKEKRIKGWKLRLIEGDNPNRENLYHHIVYLDSGSGAGMTD